MRLYIIAITALYAIHPTQSRCYLAISNDSNATTINDPSVLDGTASNQIICSPTEIPSAAPSTPPTKMASQTPSSVPSEKPSPHPSLRPTLRQSSNPTVSPSSSPSVTPSSSPSIKPSHNPTSTPSVTPSSNPTSKPTSSPTTSPSVSPSQTPSSTPSSNPTYTCDLDPMTRREQIYNVLVPVVTPADEMKTVDSSANLAFEWLVNKDGLYLCPDDPKIIQRYIVAKIYFQQEGDTWLECSNPEYSSLIEPSCDPRDLSGLGLLKGNPWLDASHECDWAFITCNDDNCITKIEVDDNDVGGTLVNEIDYLSMLEVFTMDGHPNHIGGTIPTQFGNLTALRIFDLDENELTGTIPEQIYHTAQLLEQLDLDSNHLSGTISTMIGTLKNLWFIQLFNNTLSGPIPSELAGLEKISK